MRRVLRPSARVILSLYELQHVCSGRVLEASKKGSQPRHRVAAAGAKELFVANLVDRGPVSGIQSSNNAAWTLKSTLDSGNERNYL